MKFIKAVLAATVTALVLSLLTMTSAHAAGPKAKIVNDGYLTVKVKTNVKSAVLIAPSRSGGKPVKQAKGTKIYKIKTPIRDGNSATWSVVVYNLANGEIITNKDLTWRNWKKISKKSDTIVVNAKKVSKVWVKFKKGNQSYNERATRVAIDGRNWVFAVPKAETGFRPVSAVSSSKGFKSLAGLYQE